MKYWVWLQTVLKYANGRTLSIIDWFGNAKNIFDSDIEVLRASRLFSKEMLIKLEKKDLSEAEAVISYCKENGITVIPYGTEGYPNNFMNIPDPPIVIYVFGKLPDFDSTPSVCIVGPRECSEFGIKAAYSLAARLSRGGMLIASGGAVGIDTAALKGALSENSPAVSFLPHGFGFDYLAVNSALRREVANTGCLITEFLPNTPVYKGAFQIRNRLRSAITMGTVVVEAGEHSGALITARHAVEQGKDVFVIPGNPTLPHYVGSNKLLRDGAKPLLSAMDVFDEYIGLYYDKLDIEKAMGSPLKPMGVPEEYVAVKEPAVAPKSSEAMGVSATANAIYLATPDETFCIDELSVFNDYNASELMTATAELEMFGYIKAVPGGRYIRIK